MSVLYECIKEGNPHPVVSAFVVCERMVLLVLRGRGSYEGYWALPGGMIDRGEEPEEAVLRELYEETGITGTVPALLTAYLIKCNTGLVHTSIDIIYRVHVHDATLFRQNTTEEIVDVSFFPLTELPKQIAFDHRKIINKYSGL